MSKLTFSTKNFKEDLFDYLDEKFDEAAENGLILQDAPFLGKLSRMTINTEKEIYVSHLIQEIKDYVKLCRQRGLDIGPVVQELYELIDFDFTHNLEFLIQSVDSDPIKKDEFVQLVMQHFESEGRGYNGYLVHNDEPKEHERIELTEDGPTLIPSTAALYYRLNQVIAKDAMSNSRIQIIVRQQEHYTLIDIDKQARSAFVIDSAGDAKALILNDFARYSPHIDKVYHVVEHDYDRPLSGCPSGPGGGKGTSRIQKDKWSCSVFALEFSRLVANRSDLHHMLDQQSVPVLGKDTQYCLAWDVLDSEYVAVSQSPTYRFYRAEALRAVAPGIAVAWEREGFFGTRKEEFKCIALSLVQTEDPEILNERLKRKNLDHSDLLKPSNNSSFVLFK